MTFWQYLPMKESDLMALGIHGCKDIRDDLNSLVSVYYVTVLRKFPSGFYPATKLLLYPGWWMFAEAIPQLKVCLQI